MKKKKTKKKTKKTVCAMCGRVMTAENKDWMCQADIARCYAKKKKK